MNIILASQSPSRKQLLSQTGLSFLAVSPNINEEVFFKNYKQGDDPQALCLEVAKAKALKISAQYPQHIIIAADQMTYLKGQFYGKAITETQAINTLENLQGQTHELITALHMKHQDQILNHITISKMSMRPLTTQQITNYVKEERPLHSAGSYHIETKGINLFQKIETEDFNAILGLPLTTVVNQLLTWGCLLPL